MAPRDYTKKMPDALDRNIEQIARLREKYKQRRSPSAILAEGLGEFIGSISSVYLHLSLFVGWIVFNLGWIPGTTPIDPPPFAYMNVFVCVEAIFLSMFVLIRQRRTMHGDEKRSELDLQMSLITEHELTRLVRLTDLIATKIGVDGEGEVDDLTEVMREIDPIDVIDRMEQSFEKEH